MEKKDVILEMCKDVNEKLKSVKKEEKDLLEKVLPKSSISHRRQKSIVAHRI